MLDCGEMKLETVSLSTYLDSLFLNLYHPKFGISSNVSVDVQRCDFYIFSVGHNVDCSVAFFWSQVNSVDKQMIK